MCKADVSLLTFDWVSNDRAPKPNFDIEHECKNWESIDAWAEDHAFNIFDETILVHPTLGTSKLARGTYLKLTEGRDRRLGPSFPEAEFKNTGKIPGHPGFLHEHGGMVE